MMTVDNHFLHGFFNANSVAVVGATNNPFKTNYRLTENLVSLNYAGRVYPVNPNEKEIFGLKAYPRLRDIPGEIGFVVIAIRPALIMDVVNECHEIGIKRMVIVTGGFPKQEIEAESCSKGSLISSKPEGSGRSVPTP